MSMFNFQLNKKISEIRGSDGIKMFVFMHIFQKKNFFWFVISIMGHLKYIQKTLIL